MSAPVLEAINLVKQFGGIAATNDVSLKLQPGARHALIGPNGAGKTTLINLLTGVLAPSSGSVKLEGADVTSMAPFKRVRRGLVRTFQINQLFDSMTPREAIALAVAQHSGLGAEVWRALVGLKSVAAKVDHLLELLRLSEHADKPVPELPYGKRRLLEIGLALACEPRVLLLDEPAAGVPAGEREELLQTVAALPAQVSVLLIEHDMDLVFDFASRITVLVNGAVLTEGSPKEIAADPRVKEVYLGHG